jgi:chaperonin GroEL (HSP60 family)
MNKMVINHLEKLFVTSDASTIVTELEVNHPAAKLLVMAAKAQAAEVGDGTNLVSDARPAACLSTLTVHSRSYVLSKYLGHACMQQLAAPASLLGCALRLAYRVCSRVHHPDGACTAAQVLSLAGELLGNAEGLLREGLHTAEIADGYQKSLDKVRWKERTFSAVAAVRAA